MKPIRDMPLDQQPNPVLHMKPIMDHDPEPDVVRNEEPEEQNMKSGNVITNVTPVAPEKP